MADAPLSQGERIVRTFDASLKSRIASVLPHWIVSRLIQWRHGGEIREQVRTRRELRIPSIAELDFSGLRTSDTLFVLGSGSSINDMPDERFATIARHDSVGFNFWLAHPFAPKLYLFYPGARPHEHVQFHRLMAERARDYAGSTKIVTDLFAASLPVIRGCPPAFMTGMYGAEREILFARDVRELEGSLLNLERRGVFDEHASNRPVQRLFKYCATLSTTLALALHMGHRRVVLCGIDLHNSRYFYEDAERFPEMAGFHTAPSRGEEQHATTQRWSPLMLPIDEVVCAMRDTLFIPRGVELYVENERSALCPRVRVFDAAKWSTL